ncbi:MAG TPA: gas vesicle protein GvpG [Actinomycetota bacterium]|nr:gas vesicle protein GvpG [Actinomycetota bacterium]
MVANVLLLPLLPLQGMVWLARLLEDMAANELDAPRALRARLHEAEEACRRGEIASEELERIEEAVFQRLRAPGGLT